MKKTKTKTKLVDTHPKLYAVLLVIGSMVAFSVVVTIIQTILRMIIMGQPTLKAETGLMPTIISFAAYLIVFALYCIKHRKDFKGFFRIKGLGSGLLLGWSEIAVILFIFIAGILEHKVYGNIGLGIFLGLKPGVCEEIVFRIIPLSLIMKHEKREQLMIPAIITISAIFGLIHGANLLSGANPVATLFQVLYAAGTGFLFAAIYLRTGNMWITIVLHSLADINYYIGAQAQLGTGALTGSVNTFNAILYLVYAALYFANAFYIFRKSKREEVPQLWSDICTQEK